MHAKRGTHLHAPPLDRLDVPDAVRHEESERQPDERGEHPVERRPFGDELMAGLA